jgi:predicted  nucleic acid-binding Zn-ribbon protein
MSKRNEYITKMKLQLDELNATMNKLETKAQAAKEDVRDVYREEMRKLRHESKLALAKFEEVKASGEEGWEKMVAEMDKVSAAFQHAFHYFKSQL